MATVCGLLDADFVLSCDDKAKGGLENDVILVNYSDVDYSTLTLDATNKTIVTNFQLKSGSTGYLLQGVKQVNSTAYELVKQEFSFDTFKHIFNGVILTPNSANKEQAEKLASGGRYVVIVNRKYKGASNADAFEIYGLGSGLDLETMTYNSKENNGVISFALASAEGEEETGVPKTYLDTDYPTSLAAFENKFVEA
jgi:hypothetical protein